jgi:hypothetical protein
MGIMTTTVTTTTIASSTILGLGAAIALLVVLLLIGFMVAKEIVTSASEARARSVGRVLNVGVAPLLIIFAVIIATKLVPIFS